MPITKGKYYIHPDDGVIYITSGYYEDFSNGRISNHFHWEVIATGTTKNGYGGDWPEAEGWRAEVIHHEPDAQELVAKWLRDVYDEVVYSEGESRASSDAQDLLDWLKRNGLGVKAL